MKQSIHFSLEFSFPSFIKVIYGCVCTFILIPYFLRNVINKNILFFVWIKAINRLQHDTSQSNAVSFAISLYFDKTNLVWIMLKSICFNQIDELSNLENMEMFLI